MRNHTKADIRQTNKYNQSAADEVKRILALKRKRKGRKS